MNFANQFKKNDLPELYGECFFLSKLAKHRVEKGMDKLYSYLNLLSCGYGERPFYGVIFSTVVLFLFSLIYLFNGLITSNNTIIDYNWSFTKEDISLTWEKASQLGESLYFSMMTFTTVGYGNSEAIGITSRIASFFEMFIEVVLIAMITGSILRKLFR